MEKRIVKKGGKYWPSKGLRKSAWVNSNSIYAKAEKNPDGGFAL